MQFKTKRGIATKKKMSLTQGTGPLTTARVLVLQCINDSPLACSKEAKEKAPWFHH